MAVQSAGDRVANIPELLEHMLDMSYDGEGIEDRDTRSLLLAQGVSLAFRNTIIGSKKIKQHLFLIAPSIAFDGGRRQFNSLLLRGVHVTTSDGPITLSWWLDSHKLENGYAMLHIEFRRMFPVKLRPTRPEASWRRMHLRKTVYKLLSIKVEPIDGPIRMVKLEKDSPTAGEIYDAAFPAGN